MSASDYDFTTQEKAMQRFWQKQGLFRVQASPGKPKKYILDMFPYPSGAGLHVGHLLGYFGSDVMAIHARMQGYYVLHPMGFDAFGLPAEQYAIDTGQHPAVTTKNNIAAYKKLLQATGISFDWDRELATTDADYYAWTQWIFLQLFHSWYNQAKGKAEPVATLIAHFEVHGSQGVVAVSTTTHYSFSAKEWTAMDEKAQWKILADYRLAYRATTMVNWCPALGTVLANDEVKGGLSERGGHPVERKSMLQWSLRMTAYADRLLEGLEALDWEDSMKEMQRHWIGKSQGMEIAFSCLPEELGTIEVFTTRVETIFGATFLALAPEHPWIAQVLAWQKAQGEQLASRLADIATQYAAQDYRRSPETAAQQLTAYVQQAKNRPEAARLKEEHEVSGCFTGFYARHPLTGKPIPVWVADYILPGYGTGAVMAVPGHDDRDYYFAQKMGLPVCPVFAESQPGATADISPETTLMHSGPFTGCRIKEGREKISQQLQESGLGYAKVHYRLHDPVFSRQRYWGEPFPIYYKDGEAYPLDEAALPLRLPDIETYTPNPQGEPPLSRAKDWHTSQGYPLEKNTMPAWAGSSWYFLRYMDPRNDKALVSKEAVNYWQSVDLYVGGTEHATGHLLYARFFTKFLYDRGIIPFEEPFLKLISQGTIQSFSRFVYRCKGTNTFVSHGLRDAFETTPLHVSVDLVEGDCLHLEKFRQWRPDFADASFILENNQYICGKTLEKMSKSKHNTIDPWPIIHKYGADALRMYLLFLGPLQQSQPWTMQGIEGIVRFLRKVWRLFVSCQQQTVDAPGTAEELRAVHHAIRQVSQGIARCTFNTSISALMICVNQLQGLRCAKKEIITLFLRLLAPFAPHMAEYLWQNLGYTTTIMESGFPVYEPQYAEESTCSYPVTINGKLRAQLTATAVHTPAQLEAMALVLPKIKNFLAQSTVQKVVVIPRQIINIVATPAPVPAGA